MVRCAGYVILSLPRTRNEEDESLQLEPEVSNH
jgi:hypothetical protein